MDRMKFYEFKNITSSEADIYIYGEIVSEKDDWYGSENDFALTDFQKQLDALGNIQALNLYINSPGGDVFTASTVISMLKRMKNKNNVTINAYVDGLSASATSFLMMVADNIYLYKNSIVMVHKPMSIAFGNSNDMKKTIEALDKIEDSVMIPMYMDKSKIDIDTVKQLINDETWLNSDQMKEYFDVTVLDQEKVAVASISSNLFKNYKHIPEMLKDIIKAPQENSKNSQSFIDNSSESFEKMAFFDEEKENNENLETQLRLIKSSLFIKKIKGDGMNE